MAINIASTIVDSIAEQVARTPDATAVIAQDQRITYRELDIRTNQLANYLHALGVGPGSTVGIAMEHSLQTVIGLLAVLEAGAAYVPLDVSLPAERVQYMMQDAGVEILLTQVSLAGRLSDGLIELSLDELHVSRRIAEMDTELSSSEIAPESIAYVTYTSGSTGKPKGVPMPHRGICKSWRWLQSRFPYRTGDRVLLKSPLGFDVSSRWELLWPLMSGACVVVVRPGGYLDSVYIAQTILDQKITIMHFVPSMLRALLDEPGERLASLRRVFSGGEVLSSELQQLFFTKAPHCQLVDIYGATETIVVTYNDCQPVKPPKTRPTGRPVDGLPVYILDERLRPARYGEIGQLFVGGDFLAAGYLGRPDLTDAAYIRTPISLIGSHDPSESAVPSLAVSHDNRTTLFKTGDMACWHENGEIEHYGRIDHQVKIRGVRVELGEVEAVLRASARVGDAVVNAVTDSNGTKLIAYVTSSVASGSPNSDELSPMLRRELRAKLPESMIPAHFIELQELPLNRNGKVDRQALAELTPAHSMGSNSDRPDTPGKTPTEARLVGLWKRILDVHVPGVHADFFELGGNSLLAMRLLVHIRHEFGVALAMETFMERPTIAIIARQLASLEPGASRVDSGKTVGELQSEVILDSAISPDRGPVHREDAAPRRIFLTGATGFLGVFVLDALLSRTEADIHCLVRGCSTLDEARQRITRTLNRYELNVSESSRVHPVLGDLSRHNLGIGSEEFKILSQDMDSVYHAGASVNEMYPYAALRDVNVRGTHEIIRLSCSGKNKPLHHISSTAVFECSGYIDSESIHEGDSLDACERLYTGYAQSKWVAEKLVQKARERGLVATIYRPCAISGDSRTGAYDCEQTLGRLLAGLVRQRTSPDLDIMIAMAPVDYVSQAIVELSLHSDSTDREYHLIQRNPLHLDQLVDLIRDLGHDVSRQPYESWIAEVTRSIVADPGHPLAVILPSLTVPITGTGTSSLELSSLTARIQGTRTDAALEGASIICPEIDGDVLRKYLRRILCELYEQ